MTDTLQFWHPSRNELLDEHYFGWGTAVPGSSADREFRLRNSSYLYTAKTITVSVTEMGAPTVSVAGQHLLSADGQRFAATAAVVALAPREVTSRLVLRRVTRPDAVAGLAYFQVLAQAVKWI